jgi:hypothetical protein
MHKYPTSLTSLECQMSKLVHSNACTHPTTDRPPSLCLLEPRAPRRRRAARQARADGAGGGLPQPGRGLGCGPALLALLRVARAVDCRLTTVKASRPRCISPSKTTLATPHHSFAWAVARTRGRGRAGPGTTPTTLRRSMMSCDLMRLSRAPEEESEGDVFTSITHGVRSSSSSRSNLAADESVIKCPSPLNVLNDTYNYSCYIAHVQMNNYQHLITDSPAASQTPRPRSTSPWPARGCTSRTACPAGYPRCVSLTR